jgi:hypothetical protein
MGWAERQDEAEVAAVAQQEAEANGSLQASWRAQPMWPSCTPQQLLSSGRGQHRQQQAQHGVALLQPDEPMPELVGYRGQLLQVQHRLFVECRPSCCSYAHATWQSPAELVCCI